MRVIAGRARGRRLIAPQSSRRRGDSVVRPTSDLVRGAIFSALASLQADMSRVLDLYAGSGALGIEAISRGADWCDFVEQDRATCETIRQNLRATGFEHEARVYALSAVRALDKLGGPYTLVLADPPYEDERAVGVLESLSGRGLVRQRETLLVLEHSARNEPKSEIGGLALVSSRRHGDSGISIYR
ncbi:MAG: 16S rRNA (guanine(966)-N(2))-methyltransferase RsmD [Chloroflexi bacterium]|nr:MAG: 16S rRNA (guanine(966)-N(2))-methyltransferase RsmD [Chloroflexota bacterium]